MSLELIATGFVMGLAGAGHCAVMCGSACAALGLGRATVAPVRPDTSAAVMPVVVHRGLHLQVQSAGGLASGGAGAGGLGIPAGVVRPSPLHAGAAARASARAAWRDPALWAFLASRVASYSLGGAVVAASVASLATLGQTFAALRPFWVLLQVGVFALGVWLLVTGRQPPALVALTEGLAPRRARSPSAIRPRSAAGPLARAASAGAVWVFLPCGLLQSALVTAALASTPLAGAGVMAAFAMASSLGLLGAPALVVLLRRFGPAGERAVTRVAGAMLAGAAAWALWLLSTSGLARALCGI